MGEIEWVLQKTGEIQTLLNNIKERKLRFLGKQQDLTDYLKIFYSKRCRGKENVEDQKRDHRIM